MDDGRTMDGRKPDHGHPISSPCEPNGSGELTTTIGWSPRYYIPKFVKIGLPVLEKIFEHE